VVVGTDGKGVVSQAGTALLRELAERSGLRAEPGAVMDGLRVRGGGHDPGQVLREGPGITALQRRFGCHPRLCFLDNTNEALAGLLQTGLAGSSVEERRKADTYPTDVAAAADALAQAALDFATLARKTCVANAQLVEQHPEGTFSAKASMSAAPPGGHNG